MKPTSLPLLAIAVVMTIVPAFAPAQSRSAQVYTGATNGLNPLQLLTYEDSAGSRVETSVNADFTGQDGTGQQRTMNLNGTASASSEFGSLHVAAGGMLSNTYYSESNAPYYDEDGLNTDGSPDQFGVVSYAGFIDGLQFGGQLQSGYKARYYFHVDGTTTGRFVNTFLDFTIAGESESHRIDPLLATTGTTIVSDAHPVNGQFQQTIEVLFTTQFNPNAQGVPYGSTITGSGDFSNTAQLTGVMLFDENDQPVQGFTISSSSGTNYPISSVPEPATMAAFAMGSLALLLRRRRR